MPKPRKDESRDDFMERCIPELIQEGNSQAQAVAVCSAYWDKRGRNAKQKRDVRNGSKDW